MRIDEPGHEPCCTWENDIQSTDDRPLSKTAALYCVDQVRYLPGLHKRYWDRLDETQREVVRLRTENNLWKAQGVREIRNQ